MVYLEDGEASEDAVCEHFGEGAYIPQRFDALPAAGYIVGSDEQACAVCKRREE